MIIFMIEIHRVWYIERFEAYYFLVLIYLGYEIRL